MFDYIGREWNVREERPTKYGFSVFLGRPVDAPRGYKTVILTNDLADFLLATRRSRFKDIHLPLGRTQLRQLRRELGVNWYIEREKWWREKESDLRTLTLEQFARKYGVSPSAVSMRLDSLEIPKPRHTGRPLPNELEREIRESLDNMSPEKLAKKLKIGVATVRRRKQRSEGIPNKNGASHSKHNNSG